MGSFSYPKVSLKVDSPSQRGGLIRFEGVGCTDFDCCVRLQAMKISETATLHDIQGYVVSHE